MNIGLLLTGISPSIACIPLTTTVERSAVLNTAPVYPDCVNIGLLSFTSWKQKKWNIKCFLFLVFLVSNFLVFLNVLYHSALKRRCILFFVCNSTITHSILRNMDRNVIFTKLWWEVKCSTCNFDATNHMMLKKICVKMWEIYVINNFQTFCRDQKHYQVPYCHKIKSYHHTLLERFQFVYACYHFYIDHEEHCRMLFIFNNNLIAFNMNNFKSK